MPWIIRGAVREMAWSEVHEDLLQKISREMEAYQAQMFSLTSTEVYNRAEEIAAMSFCLNQLMENFHDYQATDLKPLLDREKPLEFLAQRWMVEQNVDLSGEFDHVLRDAKYQEESAESGPSLC